MYKHITCRLYPTEKQEDFLNLCCKAKRYLYNHYLGRVIDKKCKNDSSYFKHNIIWLQTRSNVKEGDHYEDATFLKDVPANIKQNAVDDLYTAYKNFYKKYNKDCSYPKFKKFGVCRESFRVNGFTNIRIWNYKVKDKQAEKLGLDKNDKIKYLNIDLKVGNIKMKGNLNLLPKEKELIKEVTIYKSVDKWYASFTISFKPIKLPKTGKVIGLDLGLTRFYTTSNGRYELAEDINPTLLLKRIKFYDKILARIRRTYKRLHPRKKWIKSNRYLKIQARKQRLWSYLTNKRQDFLHKQSKKLVEKYDVIIIEDLKVKKMMSNEGDYKKDLNRKFAEHCLSDFISKLEYKANFYGKKLIKVDPSYTSQTCSKCGCINENNRLTQADFKCVDCGYKANADYNAARNILKIGSRYLH